MSNEEVTTSLNIDITQFKKTLTEANRYIRMANSEFENATAGTEKWTDSADGLRAKITQLNKVLDGQEAAAAALRHEYDRVVQEQGENSKGAQELAIKLNKQEAACKKTASQIRKYEGDLDDAEQTTKGTTQETGKMSAAFGKAAKAAGTLAKGLAGIAGKAVVTGIKGIAAASAGLVTAFLASGEASKEHITEMAKLDAAYKSAGHNAKTAAKTYEELYSVIGETDQSVEAAQQIGCPPDRRIVFHRYFADLIKRNLGVRSAGDHRRVCAEQDIFRKIRDFRHKPFPVVELHFFPGEHISRARFADGDAESGPFQQDCQEFCRAAGFSAAEDGEWDFLEEVHLFFGLRGKECNKAGNAFKIAAVRAAQVQNGADGTVCQSRGDPHFFHQLLQCFFIDPVDPCVKDHVLRDQFCRIKARTPLFRHLSFFCGDHTGNGVLHDLRKQILLLLQMLIKRGGCRFQCAEELFCLLFR